MFRKVLLALVLLCVASLPADAFDTPGDPGGCCVVEIDDVGGERPDGRS